MHSSEWIRKVLDLVQAALPEVAWSCLGEWDMPPPRSVVFQGTYRPDPLPNDPFPMILIIHITLTEREWLAFYDTPSGYAAYLVGVARRHWQDYLDAGHGPARPGARDA